MDGWMIGVSLAVRTLFSGKVKDEFHFLRFLCCCFFSSFFFVLVFISGLDVHDGWMDGWKVLHGLHGLVFLEDGNWKLKLKLSGSGTSTG